MKALEKMPGHPRLYRRGAVYYHRAAIPKDIKDTYGKAEETFSLGTKDYAEAVIQVRIAAARIDRKFEKHRSSINGQVDKLTLEQLKHIRDVYYHHLLDEDDEVRFEGFFDPEVHENTFSAEGGPRDTFKETIAQTTGLLEVTQKDLAMAREGIFFRGEAEEILTWENVNINLSSDSKSWRPLVQALQQAYVLGAKAKLERLKGEVVETPPEPTLSVSNAQSLLLLSECPSSGFLEPMAA